MPGFAQGAWRAAQVLLPHSIELERSSAAAGLLTDFKAHLRISGTAEDTALTRYLNVALRALEDDTRRLLITGTVKEYFDLWPWDVLSVWHPSRCPVASFTSVSYYDPDDNLQEWDSANYVTDLLAEPARVIVAADAAVVSPSLDDRPNVVVIEYECGYGAAYTNLNPETVNATFVYAAWLYARGRELPADVDPVAVMRCWQNEIRRLTWSAF